MTLITLRLPDFHIKQAEQFARACDTDLKTFLEAAFADYLEELQDIADAKE